MKLGRVVLLVLTPLLAAGLASAAHAQTAVYGEFSAGFFNDLAASRTLYGGTAGVLFGRPYHRLEIQGDLQGRFVSGSNESLYSAAIGPRVSLTLKHGLSPYGEFLVGFGRYTSTSANSNEAAPGGTTDALMEFNGGIAKALGPHFDAVLDYSYAQYYALGGLYNPKTVGIGAVYHFTKR
jgi:hypothetical protein